MNSNENIIGGVDEGVLKFTRKGLEAPTCSYMESVKRKVAYMPVKALTFKIQVMVVGG